jgi:hypothetical protein
MSTEPHMRIRPPKGKSADALKNTVLGHQPELLDAFTHLYGTLWQKGIVDHPTKEVARLRNARITDCGY